MVSVVDLLAISTIPQLGSLRIRTLLARFGGVDGIEQSTTRELAEVQGFTRKVASEVMQSIKRGALEDGRAFAERQLSRLNVVGGTIITFWDPAYPELLKKIYDPPLALFALGRFRGEDATAVSIVGTRSPTEYGIAMAEYFARELVRAGVTVVSGLARGIDTVAHRTALESRGRTIAVTGSGLDVIYPAENKSLYHRIPAHGAIVTECPMGEKPDAINFPRRNRIISGLTIGCVVVETDEKGGAMITASTALEQNREIFAVPGNVTSRRSRGCHALIRDGRAKLVESVDDILAEFSHRLHLVPRAPSQHRPAVDVTLFEGSILSALGDAPAHVDLIAEKTKSPVADVLVGLLALEIKGLVRQLPGKRFVRR